MFSCTDFIILLISLWINSTKKDIFIYDKILLNWIYCATLVVIVSFLLSSFFSSDINWTFLSSVQFSFFLVSTSLRVWTQCSFLLHLSFNGFNLVEVISILECFLVWFKHVVFSFCYSSVMLCSFLSSFRFASSL